MTLEAAELGIVQRLLQEHAAIALGNDQGYLVESRLTALARETGCITVAALVTRLERDASLRTRAIEALTTNETSFFRDQHPFLALKSTVIPELIAKRQEQRRLSMWSAAASSGQEAYSIAMLLQEAFPLTKGWNVRILGTDISTAMIERAKSGVFSRLEVGRGIPEPLLARYFQKHGQSFRVREELRRVTDWKTMNLARIDPGVFGFDVVFLRNVLIYFNSDTRAKVLHSVLNAMRPDGYLFLGATETPHGLCRELEPISVGRTTVYRRSSR